MLGEAYTPDDEEDSAAATVGAVWAYQARYRVPLNKAVAGNWVLLEGVDATSESSRAAPLVWLLRRARLAWVAGDRVLAALQLTPRSGSTCPRAARACSRALSAVSVPAPRLPHSHQDRHHRSRVPRGGCWG